MKTVFNASSTLLAHMAMHQLQGAGIDAQLLGEHLNGALGELPAYGNVRIVVEDKDVAEAEQVLADWEANDESA